MSEDRKKLIQEYGERIIQTTQSFSVQEYVRTAKRFRKLYNGLLPDDHSIRVLDVGCGDGHFLYYLREQGYQNLEGIDASEERLNRCRAHVVTNVHTADALDWLRRHPAAYDLVACHHVVEHFPDDALYEFVRLLAGAVAPGGRLIVTTPNGASPWAGYNIYHDLTHCRLFTSDSLTQLLAYAGMKDIRMLPEGAVAFDAPSAVRWLVWKLWESLIKIDYRIQIGGTRGNQTAPLIVSPNLIGVSSKPENRP